MNKIAVVRLPRCPAVLVQRQCDSQDASAYFDIEITVANCEDGSCSGKAPFVFSKKGSAMPYQVIKLAGTHIELGENKRPNVNVTLGYDSQSVGNIGAYNFDGISMAWKSSPSAMD